MARALAQAGVNAIYSYAGRTIAPHGQPLPVRTGGFGGIAGLAAFLRAETITHVVDATHPFAAQMSAHAVAACRQTGVALVAFERPPWIAQTGDRWTHAPDMNAAVMALPQQPTRIFLALGRQNLAAFALRPEHDYLLRFVDPPTIPPPLVHCTVIVSRGPFTRAGDKALLEEHGIGLAVAKNAGGDGRAPSSMPRAIWALPSS